MDKREIKNRIDELSNNLNPLYGRGAGRTETVLAIYFGQQTQEMLKGFIEESFRTAFSSKPAVLEIILQTLSNENEKIQDCLISIIEDAGRSGVNLQHLSVAFIALMDDPVFDQNACSFVQSLEKAFQELTMMGLYIKGVAFYGLFRAREAVNHDYTNSLAFVREGKRLWKNIFHVEVPFYVKNLKEYADLIAVHCIADPYDMHQDNSQDHYVWKSINLHCLKVPEFTISCILFKIYQSMISKDSIDIKNWETIIHNTLDKSFGRVFDDNLSGCEQYIPLRYKEDFTEVPRKRGWFGRNNTPVAVKYTFADIAVDTSVLEKLACSIYDDRILEENEYGRIIEDAISSSNAIDDNVTSVSTLFDGVLKKIEDNYREKKNISANHRIIVEEDSDVDMVLASSFKREKEAATLNKQIEMIEELRNYLNKNEAISRVIKDLISRITELLTVLQELCTSEYGGTLRDIKLIENFNFSVNTPVDKVIDSLDQRWLVNTVNDREIVLEQLNTFLTREIGHLNESHMLGEIGPGLATLEPIITIMLMPPVQGGDHEFQNVVRMAGCMDIKADSIFRESTFYMLSSRKYSSEKYIRRYHGGND